MAGVGGYRPGAGRPKGGKNKNTRDVQALAQKYGPAAIRGLVELAQTAQTEAARVAAWNSILDRAYGKPKQTVSGEEGAPPIEVIHRVIIKASNTNG